jgi:hypothetical protein
MATAKVVAPKDLPVTAGADQMVTAEIASEEPTATTRIADAKKLTVNLDLVGIHEEDEARHMQWMALKVDQIDHKKQVLEFIKFMEGGTPFDALRDVMRNVYEELSGPIDMSAMDDSSDSE